ncbi:hypothetical protein FRC02_012380 [Tulasnella sp. 418]|nr:hypothetical protein FRC02_012380 [Tulasnella sp. 418]
MSQLPPRHNDLGHGRYPGSPTVSSHYPPATTTSSHSQTSLREPYDSRDRRGFPPLPHDDPARSNSRSSSRSASRHEDPIGHLIGGERSSGHSGSNSMASHRPIQADLREIKKEPIDDIDWRSAPPPPPVHSRHSSGSNAARWLPHSSHAPPPHRSALNSFPPSPQLPPPSGHSSTPSYSERSHMHHGSGPSSPLRPLLPPISTDVRIPLGQPPRPSSSSSYSSHQHPHMQHLPPLSRVPSTDLSLGSRPPPPLPATPFTASHPPSPPFRPQPAPIAEPPPEPVLSSHLSSSRPPTRSAPQGPIPAMPLNTVADTLHEPTPPPVVQPIHSSPQRPTNVNTNGDVLEVNGSLEILQTPAPGPLRSALEQAVATEKSTAMDIDDDAGSEASAPMGSIKQKSKENGIVSSPTKRPRRTKAKASAQDADRMDVDDEATGADEGDRHTNREGPQSLGDALRQHVLKRASTDDCFDFDVVETVLKRNKLMVDQPSSRNRTSPDQLVFDMVHSPAMEDVIDTNDHIQPYLLEKVTAEIEEAKDKADRLKEQYRALNKQWQTYCQELDRQAMNEVALKTPVPSTPVDSLPPLSATLPTGRATRRTAGNLGLMADAVRSEAEFEQVMATLGSEDLADPNFLSIRNAAKIPDMISVTPDASLLNVQFDDRNGEVDYPEQFYDVATALGDWTEEEKEIFMDQFALNGKQFGKVAERLKHKTAEQCVLYYYIQKGSVVNFREVMSRGARGRRKRGGYGRRGFALLSGKQKGNALLTDIRTKMGDDEAADSPGGSPKQNTDVELPSTRRQSRRNAGSITPALLEVETGSRTRASRAAGAAANSRLRKGSPENSDADTPMRESGAESGDSNQDGDSGTPAAETRPKTRRARKPTQAADGSVNVPPARRKPLASSYWSAAEKAVFVEQLEQHGRNWTAIAAVLTTKSATQCRNYYQNNLRDSKSTFAEIAKAAEARNNMPPRRSRGGKKAKETTETRDPSPAWDSEGTPNENAPVQWNDSGAAAPSNPPTFQPPSSFYGQPNSASVKPDGDPSYSQSSGGSRPAEAVHRPIQQVHSWTTFGPESYAAMSSASAASQNGEYTRPTSSQKVPTITPSHEKAFNEEKRIPEHHRHAVPQRIEQPHIQSSHISHRVYTHDYPPNGVHGPPMSQPMHHHYERSIRSQPQYGGSSPPNPYASYPSTASPISPVGARQTPTPHSPFTQQSRTSSWNQVTSPTNQLHSPGGRNAPSPDAGRRPKPTSPSSSRSSYTHHSSHPREYLPTSQPTSLPPFGSKPLPAGATRSSSNHHHHSNASVGSATSSSLPPTPTTSRPSRAA